MHHQIATTESVIRYNLTTGMSKHHLPFLIKCFSVMFDDYEGFRNNGLPCLWILRRICQGPYWLHLQETNEPDPRRSQCTTPSRWEVVHSQATWSGDSVKPGTLFLTSATLQFLFTTNFRSHSISSTWGEQSTSRSECSPNNIPKLSINHLTSSSI